MAKKEAAAKKKGNSEFDKPMQPDDVLAAVIGDKPTPRPQVIKKIWEYIKKHNLQDPKNKRQIIADAKLEVLFGKKSVSMFELTKIVFKHLK